MRGGASRSAFTAGAGRLGDPRRTTLTGQDVVTVVAGERNELRADAILGQGGTRRGGQLSRRRPHPELSGRLNLQVSTSGAALRFGGEATLIAEQVAFTGYQGARRLGGLLIAG